MEKKKSVKVDPRRLYELRRREREKRAQLRALKQSRK